MGTAALSVSSHLVGVVVFKTDGKYSMTFPDFLESLKQPVPPKGISQPLLALWYDGHGDWKSAHETAQKISDITGSRIHAYLHRKERDLSNASYWYGRAAATLPAKPLDEEWNELVQMLLNK
jgi:hypothetical protein